VAKFTIWVSIRSSRASTKSSVLLEDSPVSQLMSVAYKNRLKFFSCHFRLPAALEQQERLRHRDQEHHLTLLPPHLQQQLPSHLQQQPQQLLLQEDAQRQPPKELRYPVPRELQFRKMEDTVLVVR
jgi:hypothetical protein